MCACPIVRKSSRALRSRRCATAQAIPEKTELPGFERRFSEGTGPYTVSHGVPMNETDRNPPFLTDQDWHISGSYDLEKIEEIKLRQKAEIDAIARSELDERCGSPPAERATLALGLPPVLSSYLPITPPHHYLPSPSAPSAARVPRRRIDPFATKEYMQLEFGEPSGDWCALAPRPSPLARSTEPAVLRPQPLAEAHRPQPFA